jgi:hypothetical protein
MIFHEKKAPQDKHRRRLAVSSSGNNFCIGLSFGGRKIIAIGLSTGHSSLLSLIAIFIKIRYPWLRSLNAAQAHEHLVAIL